MWATAAKAVRNLCAAPEHGLAGSVLCYESSSVIVIVTVFVVVILFFLNPALLDLGTITSSDGFLSVTCLVNRVNLQWSRESFSSSRPHGLSFRKTSGTRMQWQSGATAYEGVRQRGAACIFLNYVTSRELFELNPPGEGITTISPRNVTLEYITKHKFFIIYFTEKLCPSSQNVIFSCSISYS